jgi:shikimate kinase / 3-dehydroquinate synthase
VQKPLHIALVGFMGSGKSAVGRCLAQKLNIPFVDLDRVIEMECGQKVADIFQEHGEVGFRARERAALRHVLEQEESMVIATGGGTFIDPAMRAAIKKDSRTIYLRADIASLASRLEQAGEIACRPLLVGPDPRATIKRLMRERSGAYLECEHSVSTDGEDVDKVAERIHVWLESSPAQAPRRQLSIDAQRGSYPIEIRPNKGTWIAEEILEGKTAQRIGIVTDTTVMSLYGQALYEELNQGGARAFIYPIKGGESCKNLETVDMLYDVLCRDQFERQDLLVAVGGGVVGDVTGFVASTLLRGIGFIQVPTTTLAAVDSSVGGKTGLNTMHGKNLVGTFYPPDGVWVAIDYLRSQNLRQHRSGLVEALKMAATSDARLFDDMVCQSHKLLDFEGEVLMDVVSRALQIKAAVVSDDEREHGLRAILNYGHTIGHAMEVAEGSILSHGEAVALGMLAESAWAKEKFGIPRVHERLLEALNALGAPTHWRQAPLDWDALALDKKRQGAHIKLPVVGAVGEVRIEAVDLRELADFIRRRMD